MKHRINDYSHDLASPDGEIISLRSVSDTVSEAIVFIENISPWFVGFEIEPALIFFNGKSVLAQLGVDCIGKEYDFDKVNLNARVKVELIAHGPIAQELLKLIDVGSVIGKLFAKDERRRVREPEYISRMFGRSDRWGKPLLSLGAMHGSDSLILDKVDGRAVAYLTLLNGRVGYDETIFGFLPTLARSLSAKKSVRDLLKLHQVWHEGVNRNVTEGEILLVRTPPLHIRTVFAHVVDELLTPGYQHTSASILQPDTQASGDIYEFWGTSKREITDVALEFYTLEPYRENIFFADRDKLQGCLSKYDDMVKAFETAPKPDDLRAAVFIVKGHQLEDLKLDDWIAKEDIFNDVPALIYSKRQTVLVERFIEQQPSYPFLKAIEMGTVTSQGVLLTRHFMTPLLKRMLLSESVARCLKGIYFRYPSRTFGDFFSNEDRALLNDLQKFGVPVYWVDDITKKILQYVQKPKTETGMFVPLGDIDRFLKATVFGVYGSNLVVGPFEANLSKILAGVLEMRSQVNHPLLSKETPLALVTGGGPGAMEAANRIAKELGILSCANIADFRLKGNSLVNEQRQNAYIEAKMTYRLKELVERQAEFNLDFPIFVQGGIGTDFEYCLEEVRRKVGCIFPTPVLLFGDIDYWKSKITTRYQCNLKNGTIKGSEWISGCFFSVNSAQEGIEVYKRFFEGTLKVGKEAKPQPLGFVVSLQDVD
jgi:predicted Rossmann-fold nucleotide-binding protein